MEVGENKVVKFNYLGKLNNGEVFGDSSKDGKPLEFFFGEHMILPKLEEAITGLKVGDKKNVSIGFKDAYGELNNEFVQEVPRKEIPKEIDLKLGMFLETKHKESGQAIPAKVKGITDEIVTIDFNHPLAGEDLTFDVEITEIRDQTEEEKKQIEMMKQQHQHQHNHEGGDSCCSGKENCKKEDKVCDKGDSCCNAKKK